MRAWLLRLLGGASNNASDDRGRETRTNDGGGLAGDARGGASASDAEHFTDEQRAELGELDRQWGELVGGIVERQLDEQLAAIRSAITTELDQLRERMDREERRGRELTDEWHEALARFAKIGNRLAAQARRDLKKSTDELDALPLGDDPSQLPLIPPPLPPAAHGGAAELTREQIKARIRRAIGG